jgi:hypothetical protein
LSIVFPASPSGYAEARQSFVIIGPTLGSRSTFVHRRLLGFCGLRLAGKWTFGPSPTVTLPIIHLALGSRQVVRHPPLERTCGGSNPSSPAMHYSLRSSAWRRQPQVKKVCACRVPEAAAEWFTAYCHSLRSGSWRRQPHINHYFHRVVHVLYPNALERSVVFEYLKTIILCTVSGTGLLHSLRSGSWRRQPHINHSSHRVVHVLYPSTLEKSVMFQYLKTIILCTVSGTGLLHSLRSSFCPEPERGPFFLWMEPILCE